MSSPILSELPSPPPGKTGWPWTEQSRRLPDFMPDGRSWPRISVVTPSYNQGAYIEETIRSVLLQGYPNLEYIVMDGGSTDQTLSVLEKYRPFCKQVVSERDEGQAHAINKGFAYATGDIGAYLNSDDYYMRDVLGPVALSYDKWKWDLFLGRQAATPAAPTFRWLRRSWWKQRFPLIPPFLVGEKVYGVSQESTFWCLHHVQNRRFDDRLRFCLDVDWYCKIARGSRILLSSHKIGYFRIHPESKTTLLQHVAHEEIGRISQREAETGIDWARNAEIKRAFLRSQPALLMAFLLKGRTQYAYTHPD